jgi:hypothetical protein
MQMSPAHLEKLVRRVYPKMNITAVYHPRVTPRLIEMPNGVNVRFERGQYGYQLGDGLKYPPEMNQAR